jgi:hypothetical protein
MSRQTFYLVLGGYCLSFGLIIAITNLYHLFVLHTEPPFSAVSSLYIMLGLYILFKESETE